MPIPTDAVLRLGPGGSFVDVFVADESRTRLQRAELEATGDSFGENSQGGGRGGWGSGGAGGTGGSGGFVREGSRDGYRVEEGPFARGDHDSVRVSARASRAGALLLAETLLSHQGASIKGVSCTIASLVRRRAMPAPEGGARGLRSTFASSVRSRSAAHRWNLVPHEPHSQAAEDSETDPRLSRAVGLFPDDAGARRRARREQGHGLRACRGAHPQGGAASRAEQGTLFVDR